ncbi:DMT family transporter [Sphingomonas sp. SRS2]|uniref:DMT family transporter n=1 Tax=Sphingomonas sp. SRS2 TaxID=133190 RepID=UPI0006184755|nr:DMT family transporter [Sphingomonas sp. SRS2]KKC27042.1 permease [Sphingomonas sp. SRS2]
MQQEGETRFAKPQDSGAVNLRAFAAMIVANIALAFGPWMVRVADVSPLSSAFWRLALAVPFLFLLTRVARQPVPRLSGAMMATIAIGGLCFAADLGAWHIGIHHTKLANATLFGNFATFLLAAFALISSRTWPDRPQTAALLLAAIGTLLLLGRSYDVDSRYLKGDLFCILAGVFYTGYLIAMGRARGMLQPMPVLLISTLAGTAPLLLFALADGGAFWPDGWTPLLLLAIGSQVIGQGLMVYAIGHLPPMLIGLGLLMQPFIAALIGSLRYGERLGLVDILGGLAICAALVLVRMSKSGAPTPVRVDTAT